MSDGYVNLTRIYEAPRELVWRAWTEPQQVAQWWGPHEFDTPLESLEIDLREGGVFNLVMIENASGNEFPLRCEIVELVEHELLLMRSAPQPEVGLAHETTCRVEFADEEGKTRLTVTTGPFTAEMEPMANAGWTAQLERLETLLAGAPY